MATLIVFSGLPASGKSSIARALAQEIGAIWLRIDSIEQAIRESGVVPGSVDDAGYRAAYALAEDNLRLGHDVNGDSVNPWMLTRDAWRACGVRAGARVVEVEAICSDREEHRRRVKSRANEVPGLILPDWEAVLSRDYHAWDRNHVMIDTAQHDVAACVELIRAAIYLVRAANRRWPQSTQFRHPVNSGVPTATTGDCFAVSSGIGRMASHGR